MSKLASPALLLVSPPQVSNERYNDGDGNVVFGGAIDKSKQLAQHIAALAEENACYFIDLALYVQPSDIDGVHFSPQTHRRIAELMYQQVKNILS